MHICRGSFSRVLCMVVIVGALVLAGVARGKETTDQSVQNRNAAIVAKTSGSVGVFEVQENGDILHIQSGVRCPASFKNVGFRHVLIFSAPHTGTDIGCDYGRTGPDGYSVSKLTIFATRTTESIDQVFAGVQQEIAESRPEARYIGPAVEMVSEDGDLDDCSPIFGDFRSAEYEFELNGVRYLSDAILTIRSGWIIKVRATFSTEVQVGSGEQDLENAVNAAGDMVAPSYALISVLGNLNNTTPDEGNCDK